MRREPSNVEAGLVDANMFFATHADFPPNRLIKGPVGKTSKLYDELLTATDPRLGKARSMQDVRSSIERYLKDRSYVKSINSRRSNRAIDEKMAIRRMMSHYWDNYSTFGLDLVGAVVRQGSFIEKMHSIDWIHSPSASATMTHLITKYERFISIIALNPNRTAVPTLDIDLAWHTHQLSPHAYYAYTRARIEKFLDQDDKLEETHLSYSFEWTSKTYQKIFNNEPYSECTCWYCEAIRGAHISSVKRLFSSGGSGDQAAVDRNLERLHAPSDPRKGAHISAHNAIRAETPTSRFVRESNLKAKLERDYQRSVLRAKTNGKTPPPRDQFANTYLVWGYPMYFPYYTSYSCDPGTTGGMYVSNPACATFVPGGAGNRVSGACGGGFAAGACAGNGAGGCIGSNDGGSSAGGCGGGGGGYGGGGGCGGGGGGGGA